MDIHSKIMAIIIPLLRGKNRDYMLEYVFSQAHQKAIDLFNSLGEGKTCHNEESQIPNQEEALFYWERNAK